MSEHRNGPSVSVGGTVDAIRQQLEASVAVKHLVLADPALLQAVARVSESIVEAFRAKGKVLFCGNGGSAADAQHLSAELSGRYYFDRPPLYAEALHVNTSYLTAVGNDYGYEQVFSRLVQAQGRRGDVLIGLSTSGNSKNVVAALQVANDLGMITVGMTGAAGGKMKEIATHMIKVPSTDTPRIQECHITLGHIICEHVERVLFGSP